MCYFSWNSEIFDGYYLTNKSQKLHYSMWTNCIHTLD